MTAAQPSWAVVATVREPVRLVRAFAAYHLARGAARVILFVDDGDAGHGLALSDLSGCEVVVCDAAYWHARGGRPHQVVDRQKANVQRVYDAGVADWVLHIDADEFLAPGTDLGAALARLDADAEIVRLPVAERVRWDGTAQAGLLDGAFRLPAPGDRGAHLTDVYGRDLRYLNAGVKAYAHWKSCCRTGRGMRMGVHGPLALTPTAQRRAVTLPRPALLHFDGLTPRHWVLKMLRKAGLEDWRRKPNVARARQLRLFTSSRLRPSDLLRFYRRLDTLDAGRSQKLRALGLLHEPRPSLPATVAAVSPDAAAALETETFDADLALQTRGDPLAEAVLATRDPMV